MSAHEDAVAEQHIPGSTRLFVWVWVALLVMTGIETFLAYENLALLLMLTILMGLSLVKSAYILSYFMHLRFEKLGMFLLIVPTVVFIICMILIFLYPDTVRMLHMRA
ncbi:MAG TPA: cytochrome C oxidase subunit IV family protein [Candidatus Acidoferrales bacterium]|nr:cytochrome C oxidase subunit IV family protein [Candidatus Acidoferrales bacterium]